MGDDEIIIRTRSLTKIYGSRTIALNGVDLSVRRGSVFGFLGPNGAGKTTTLRLILGLQQPSAGSVEVFGTRSGPNTSGIRARIGYLPTNPEFPPDMTPITYLDFVGKLCGMNREARTPRLAGLIRAVGLLHAQARRVGTFSTGMRTRLGIAASLMHDPELIVWDEPCSGLDPAGRRHTMDLIRWMAGAKTVVVSSHILTDIDQVCTHVGVLSEGRLIFCGEVAEMKRQIRIDAITVELLASEDSLASFVGQAKACAWVGDVAREGGRFILPVTDGAAIATALSDVLAMTRKAEAELISVTTGLGRVEDAYLQMLEDDGAQGFMRACGGNGLSGGEA